MKEIQLDSYNENRIDNSDKDFYNWFLFLKSFKYGDQKKELSSEIISLEFTRKGIIVEEKDFWWFRKRKLIWYVSIENILMKEYDLKIIETFSTYTLVYKDINNNEKNISCDKEGSLRFNLFIKFINYKNLISV